MESIKDEIFAVRRIKPIFINLNNKFVHNSKYLCKKRGNVQM